MNKKYYIGRHAKSITIGEKMPAISKVILNGDNDAVFTAGDDSGQVLETFVPTATQGMAQDILNKAKGFRYQGYIANNAYLAPEAELGDGITADGIYSILASREYSFTPKMTENISAPYQSEPDHEYDYTGNYERDINKKVQIGSLYYGTRISRKNGLEIVKTDGNIEKSRVLLNSDTLAFYNDNGKEAFYYDSTKGVFRLSQYANVEDALDGSAAFSSLELTAEKLQLQIQDANGNISSLQQTASSLQSQITSANGNISSLQQTASSLQSQITSTDGNISSLQQYVDSITLSVSNGKTSSKIQLKSGSAVISSGTISMEGLVTYTGLAAGTTTINGGCIKTGTIDAERLNLTGKITFTDLNSSTQTKINTASTNANKANTAIQNWTYPNSTEIDGTKIATGTVIAGKLQGGEVNLLTSTGIEAGTFTIQSTDTSSGRRGALDIKSDAIALKSENAYGLIRFDTLSTGVVLRAVASEVVVKGNILPQIDEIYNLGSNYYRWNDIYLANDPIVLSDTEEKKDIVRNLNSYDSFFDLLKPSNFKLVRGTSDRIHIGLISQDIEKALENVGLTSQDFAGFIKSPKQDSEGNIISEKYNYALRYGEFIALCIDQIQKLKSRVTILEGGAI